MSDWIQGFLVGYGLACFLVFMRIYVWEKKIRNVRSSGNTD